jgi:hypothetical protein
MIFVVKIKLIFVIYFFKYFLILLNKYICKNEEFNTTKLNGKFLEKQELIFVN